MLKPMETVEEYMIKWSFSSLKQFQTCPRQYHEVKVLENYKVKETEAMTYGTIVHKAFEDYARLGTPLPRNYLKHKATIDTLLKLSGTKFIEHEMALRIDYTPCPFDAPDRWVRGIADLIVVDGDTAYVIDYKTGSDKYADLSQLKLMALMVFNHFTDVKTVKAGLLFVGRNVFMDATYQRDKMDEYWKSFKETLARLEMSMETGNWLKRPSGLCRFCPVTSCEFNRE